MKMTSENTAHSDPHLAESSAATTRMQKCPMSCAAHADRRSRLQSAPHVPHLPHKIDITQKWARRSSKIRPSEERSPRQSFVRACAPEMQVDVLQGKFCPLRAAKFACLTITVRTPNAATPFGNKIIIHSAHGGVRNQMNFHTNVRMVARKWRQGGVSELDTPIEIHARWPKWFKLRWKFDCLSHNLGWGTYCWRQTREEEPSREMQGIYIYI